MNGAGTIKAGKEGSAQITASIDGTKESASCTVHVVKKTGQKKNAKDVAALKALINAQQDASVSNQLDDLDQYTWTDIGKERRLTRIVWPDKQLQGEISFDGLSALEYLDIRGGHLTDLDVHKNKALKYLDCSDQELTTLDISENKALETLKCDRNRFTQLQVQDLVALTELSCNENRQIGRASCRERV